MNRRTLIVSILIIAGTLILMGVSYAYFTAVATSDAQKVQSGVLELTYESGQNITLNSAFPTDESEAGISKFSIQNTGTIDTEFYLFFTDIHLVKDEIGTSSNNLKYVLYESNSDYSVQGDVLASGSFGSGDGYFKDDTFILLLDDISLASQDKKSYILKVWLQETGQLQNEDQGMSLSFKIAASTGEVSSRNVKRSIYTIGDVYSTGYTLPGSSYSYNYTTLMGEALKKTVRYSLAYSIGGEITIDQVLSSLKDTNLSYRAQISMLRNTDVITFSLGTFDIINFYNNAVEEGLSSYEDIAQAIILDLEQFFNVYDELLTEVSTIYHGHIILFGVPNFVPLMFSLDEGGSYYWDLIFAEYDRKMQAFAQENDVDYVSGYQLFKGKEKEYFQNIEAIGQQHLTEDGWIVIKDAMMKVIESYTDSFIETALVGIGDSIGGGVLAANTTSTYRAGYNEMLYEELKKDNASLKAVYGAISGATIENYLDAMTTGRIGEESYPIREWLQVLGNQDIVTCSLSGNDMLQKLFSTNKLYDFLISKTVTKEEIQLIIDGILADWDDFLQEVREVYNGHFIFLGIYNWVIPGFNFADDSLEVLAPWLEIMDYYDEKMKEISDKYHVDYVSAYQLFKGKERIYFPTDGDVHPNEAGYQLIADQMLEIIKAYK